MKGKACGTPRPLPMQEFRAWVVLPELRYFGRAAENDILSEFLLASPQASRTVSHDPQAAGGGGGRGRIVFPAGRDLRARNHISL
jgi:hypothetical protein